MLTHLVLKSIMRFIDDLGDRWVGPVKPLHKRVQWLNCCTKMYGIEFSSRIWKEMEFLDNLISFYALGNPITCLTYLSSPLMYVHQVLVTGIVLS